MYENLVKEVWPEWNIVEQLGEGTYGSVYKISHEDDIRTVTSALKVISVPRSAAEMAVLMSRYQTDEAVRAYYKQAVDEYISKMKLLESFRYNPNLVRIDEYRIRERQDMPGWYILIRMNLAAGLNAYAAHTPLNEREIISLGIDICRALEICESCGIVHGNVKPENIFVSSVGGFQLGDTLISQAMQKVQTSVSKKKLPGFLSPEEYKGEAFDIRSDIYSLGLVMYRALNKNRLPFQDTNTVSLTFAQKKEALDKRFGGEPVPAPLEAGASLAHILQKACAFSPDARYASPAELRQQLEALAAGTYDPEADHIGAIRQENEKTKTTEQIGKAATGGLAAGGTGTGGVSGKAVSQQRAASVGKQKQQTLKKPNMWKDPVIVGVIVVTALVIIIGVVVIILATRSVGGNGGSNSSQGNTGYTAETAETEASLAQTQESAAESLPAETEEAVSETAERVDSQSEAETIILTEAETTINLVDITTSYDYPSLKEYYSEYFMVGTAASIGDVKTEKVAALIVHEYNSITAENAMKPDNMLDVSKCMSNPEKYNESPALDFGDADYYLAFAQANDIQVRWHTFVWYSQTPEWFFHEDYDVSKGYASREVMLKRMESYIKQVFAHCEKYYPGVVYAADVVNEALSDANDGSLRQDNNLWYQIIGEDYIYYAFLYARKYAPSDVKLFYNDYNEYIAGKSNGIYALVEELKEEDLIDGIGMQSHLSVSYPNITTYRAALERYGQLGLEIQITELDVGISANTSSAFATQADYYKQLMQMIVEVEQAGKADITCVTLWGISDDVSWRSDSYPLLYNSDLSLKPAFYGFMGQDDTSIN